MWIYVLNTLFNVVMARGKLQLALHTIDYTHTHTQHCAARASSFLSFHLGGEWPDPQLGSCCGVVIRKTCVPLARYDAREAAGCMQARFGTRKHEDRFLAFREVLHTGRFLASIPVRSSKHTAVTQ